MTIYSSFPHLRKRNGEVGGRNCENSWNTSNVLFLIWVFDTQTDEQMTKTNFSVHLLTFLSIHTFYNKVFFKKQGDEH